MFNKDFFPTPINVINMMLDGENVNGKIILEPSAGKGNICDFLIQDGAKEVLFCENNQDLKKILTGKSSLQPKYRFLADDFLTVTSDQVSHIDLIIMNPPFSADEKHILHAFNIAPSGCKIIALANLETIKNTRYSSRLELKTIIDNFGSYSDLGKCFDESERKTGVEIALIKIQKPGESYKAEFEGFFMDEDPEETQENGIMSYNVVRDLVNRYVGAVKVFDEQLTAGRKMNDLTKSFFSSSLAFAISENGVPKARNDFKKDLQKSGWNWIFNKMNLQKYATRGLKEDINKFVEQQTEIPFTMRNIYKMLDIVIGTTESRINKAIVDIFDKITSHHADNKQNIPGWKTNSHFLIAKRFILPSYDQNGLLDDLVKSLCYVTGESFDDHESLEKYLCYANYLIDENGKFVNNTYYDFPVKYKWHDYELKNDSKPYNQEKHPNCEIVRFVPDYGKWFNWSFFRVRRYKNGNKHFEFKDENILALFNQRVAKIKGYSLFEGKKQTAYQDRQTGRAQQEKKNPAHNFKPTVLFTAKVA